ncbi:MAG: putative protein phosphatase [Chloroflexi bacterium OLB15]|nr:MAG: putative protein phosphatase [Chloroflexi bacterium OLB15]
MNWFRKLLQPTKSQSAQEKISAPSTADEPEATVAELKSESPALKVTEPAAESSAPLNGTHAQKSEPESGKDLSEVVADLDNLITEPEPEDGLEATSPQETVVLRMELDEEPQPPTHATAPLPSTGDLMISVVDGATRPLPQDAILEFSPLTHTAFGQATDVGRMRTNNQDSAFSFFASGRSVDDIPDFGLFIVADGMGGHQDGEKASAITTRTVASQVLNTMYLPMISRQNKNNDVPIAESLANATQKANIEIMSHVPEGGTTLSSVVIIGDRAYIAHVGDSRIYMFHHGILEKLTRDHSLVQRLIELDQITIEEAADHPQKNVLYRALGQNDVVEVDTLTRRLPPGAMLLLCSDGLWNQVSDSAISDVISHVHSPQEACQKLVAMANAAGGIDNVTVILLQIPG